jgi:NAD+ diphosphatase
MIPDLIYARCDLDRAAHRRRDDDALNARFAAENSRFVAIVRGRSLIAGDVPALVPLVGDAGREIAATGAAGTVFLGDDGDGAPWFAIDVNIDGGAGDEAAVKACAPGARLADLRSVGAALNRHDGPIFAYARAMVHWHRQNRFCGLCGRPTVSRDGGHARACTDPECGSIQFPRTDPVVIMLVTRPGPEGGACLLGRQPGWTAGLLSTLAGFVEPGERLEDAVAREIREEVAIDVSRIRYVASQPWPFPASLMLGFHAVAATDAVAVPDPDELEDARWLSRAEVAQHQENGGRLPFRGTMARTLIDAWVNDDPTFRAAADEASDQWPTS